MIRLGPTLFVNIGFDPSYSPQQPGKVPRAAAQNIMALVDTGATECCIDSSLATQLGLPIVDKQTIAGVQGSQSVNMYLAQIHVPSLNFTMWGRFAGVNLQEGGQIHRALMGRTFLTAFTLIYDGTTGDVTLLY